MSAQFEHFSDIFDTVKGGLEGPFWVGKDVWCIWHLKTWKGALQPSFEILLFLRVVTRLALRAIFSYLKVSRPVIRVVVVVNSSSTGRHLPILLLLRLDVVVAVVVIAVRRGFGSIWPLFGHFRHCYGWVGVPLLGRQRCLVHMTPKNVKRGTPTPFWNFAIFKGSLPSGT